MHPINFTICRVILIVLIWMSICPVNSWSYSRILFNWLSTKASSSVLQKQSNYYNGICNTDSCKQTGKLFLQGLNRNINPCDNFYEFTCGQWIKSNPIPLNKLEWSCMRRSDDNIERRSLNIIESKLKQYNAINSSILLRQFFKHCMDKDSREKSGIIPIINIIKEGGGWPLIGNYFNSNEIKWQYVNQYYFELLKSYSIFEITVASDYLNRGNNQIMIAPEQSPRIDFFPLSERWKNWPNDTSYTILVKNVGEIFLNEQHINFIKEDFDNDILDMLEFEYKLHKIQIDAANSSKDMITIGELQKHYDNVSMIFEDNQYIYKSTAKINWIKIIQQIFIRWNFTIDDNEKLFVPQWDFFTKLPKLLSATSNKAIVNYINWKFVMLMMPFTNDRMKELISSGTGKIFLQTDETRRHDCLTENRLKHVLYREYAQKYFPKREKLEINNMAELMRDDAIQIIKNSDWIDIETRKEIVEKIRNINIMIGYPNWYDDNGTAINNYYEKLIPGQSHFEDTLNNIKFVNEKNLAKFRQPMETHEWFLQPLSVNGMYKYYFNSLLVTMAFAQSPIYSTDLPIAVKYGLLGSIIGHELFHSLDPKGIGYDKDGKKIISPFKTINKYRNKINCIVDQYNNRTIIEMDPTANTTIEINVKGNITKNEDMADIEGIRNAFITYRANLNKNKPSRLIGLEEFNSDQLFFISYANKWCHAAKIKWWEDNYENNKYDVHSPSRLRVNRPMSNLKEFAETFNCPNDSNMNPKIKCIVFDNV